MFAFGALAGAILATVVLLILVDTRKAAIRALRMSLEEMQLKFDAEVRKNTRLEIENARMSVDLRETRRVATRAIDRELAAKAKAAAA